MSDFVDDSFSENGFDREDDGFGEVENLGSSSSVPFDEFFDSFDEGEPLPSDLDCFDLPLSDSFREFLQESVSDVNAVLDVDYWHIANVLVLFVGDYDNGVNELMETVLQNNRIECQIHLSDSNPVFSLSFIFNIFEENDSRFVHITTSKSNSVNNALDLNQLHDVTNVWNSSHFIPTSNIQSYSDDEYVVRTKQVLNVTNGASINQLYAWIDSAIAGAFSAQKEIASSYIDL